jgi:hypothetical protein
MKDNNLWMELIRLIYVEGRLTKAVLAQTCMGIIFISSMSNTIFTMFFLPKQPLTTWRTAADHQWSVDHSLRNTASDISTTIVSFKSLPTQFSQIFWDLLRGYTSSVVDT